MSTDQTSRLDREVQRSISKLAAAAKENYGWLRDSVPDLLASTLRDDEALLASLAAALPRLATDREVALVDRDHELVLARLDRPGSVFETLKGIEDRDIASSEIFHSEAPVPGLPQALEVHRYEFAHPAPAGAPPPEPLPRELRRAIHAAAAARHPDFKPAALDEALELLSADNARYVRLAPPADVAQLAWIFHECQVRGGFLLDLVEGDG